MGWVRFGFDEGKMEETWTNADLHEVDAHGQQGHAEQQVHGAQDQLAVDVVVVALRRRPVGRPPRRFLISRKKNSENPVNFFFARHHPP